MIPIVASADDIDTGVKYGNNHPNARWYIGKRLEALDAVERIPEDWPETQPIVAARMPKLGTGKRFANLKGQLARRGVNNPGALAAYIGRKKFGAKRFAKLGAKARTAAAITADAADTGDVDTEPMSDTSQAGQPTAGWLRRVRAEINEAGVDPDYVEATVPGGFSSNYDGTDAVTYAEQLIEAYAESIADEFPELLETDSDGQGDDSDQADGDDVTGDSGGGEPQAVQTAVPEAAAGAVTASGAHTVNFYGGVSPDSLVASVREVVQGELRSLLAAAPPRTPDEELPSDSVGVVDPDGDGDDDSIPGGPGDTDLDGGTGVPDSVPPVDDTPPGPDGGAPVDMDAAKAKLRGRFGKAPVAAAAATSTGPVRRMPPVTPVGAPAAAPSSLPAPVAPPRARRPVMAGAAMRARLAEVTPKG